MPNPTSILNGRFSVENLLGKGGFGEVYAGKDNNTQEPIAIKLEPAAGRSWLYHEAKVMQEICTFVPLTVGIPHLKYFGQQGDFRCLVMTMHGPSLEDLHEHLGRFSLKTTVMLMHQMVSRLEYLHSVGYVHRDLKPDNFLMGVGKYSHHVYIIDFGLSNKYKATNGQHREMSGGKSFVGTTRYASLRTHQGYSQSRRDDLEQLSYIAVYMYRGRLPWSGLQIKDRDEKEKVIGEMKEKLSTAQICARCPRQFEDLLLYARKMAWSETPQYEMCRMLMASVLEEMGDKGVHDFKYDWVKPAQDEARSPLTQSMNSGVLSSANGRGLFSNANGGVLSQDEIVATSPREKE